MSIISYDNGGFIHQRENADVLRLPASNGRFHL
jgi:hypothetical protein